MDLRQEQIRRNAASDGAWELYAPHRDQVTRLVREAQKIWPARLCWLGAGNLNDLDLAALTGTFEEFVLVDVDAGALERGIARQGLAGDPRVRIAAPVDITGVLIDGPAMRDPSTVDRCLDGLGRIPDFGERGRSTVVASVGVLTQLIDGVVRMAGESHPRFRELVSAVRAQHLRLLLDLLVPGGTAVLVTEVVSSDTCPALLTTRESDLPGLLRQEVAARNFFTGTNPAMLEQVLRSDQRLVARLAEVRFVNPWLWTFLTRTYLVYAVLLQTRT